MLYIIELDQARRSSIVEPPQDTGTVTYTARKEAPRVLPKPIKSKTFPLTLVVVLTNGLHAAVHKREDSEKASHAVDLVKITESFVRFEHAFKEFRELDLPFALGATDHARIISRRIESLSNCIPGIEQARKKHLRFNSLKDKAASMFHKLTGGLIGSLLDKRSPYETDFSRVCKFSCVVTACSANYTVIGARLEKLKELFEEVNKASDLFKKEDLSKIGEKLDVLSIRHRARVMSPYSFFQTEIKVSELSEGDIIRSSDFQYAYPWTPKDGDETDLVIDKKRRGENDWENKERAEQEYRVVKLGPETETPRTIFAVPVKKRLGAYLGKIEPKWDEISDREKIRFQLDRKGSSKDGRVLKEVVLVDHNYTGWKTTKES